MDQGRGFVLAAVRGGFQNRPYILMDRNFAGICVRDRLRG